MIGSSLSFLFHTVEIDTFGKHLSLIRQILLILKVLVIIITTPLTTKQVPLFHFLLVLIRHSQRVLIKRIVRVDKVLVVVLNLNDISLYDIAIVGVALFVVEKHFGL